MENADYVQPKGISGGLALWWSDITVNILKKEKNYIDRMVLSNLFGGTSISHGSMATWISLKDHE